MIIDKVSFPTTFVSLCADLNMHIMLKYLRGEFCIICYDVTLVITGMCDSILNQINHMATFATVFN